MGYAMPCRFGCVDQWDIPIYHDIPQDVHLSFEHVAFGVAV